MIRVEVQPYCDKCRIFESDIEHPQVRYENTYDPANMMFVERCIQSDTIVRCKRRKQCENIKRFLEQQEKEKENKQND